MPLDEIRNRFSVPYEYRVIFSDGVFDAGNPTLADLMVPDAGTGPARAVVFVDDGLPAKDPAIAARVASYFDSHRAAVRLAADPQVVAGGERGKRDLGTYERCVRILHDAKLDRHSYAIAIGGGALLDVVGFAASTVHRGVRQIRVPTTVLAQNDAGIGVKNGVDYLGKKNFLGSFSPPHAVVNDFTLLGTLNAAGWRNGTAEAVKVGLIRDASFFEWIEKRADDLAAGQADAMRFQIRRCAELHLKQITTAGDPFERGSARPLDFGHWAAHKLEQLSGFTVGHGHAVAVGMAIDVLYSNRVGMLGDHDSRRVFDCIRRLGFRLDIAAEAGIRNASDVETLMQGIAEFQEHLGGALCVTMLEGIGRGVEIDTIDMTLMRGCVREVLGVR